MKTDCAVEMSHFLDFISTSYGQFFKTVFLLLHCGLIVHYRYKSQVSGTKGQVTGIKVRDRQTDGQTKNYMLWRFLLFFSVFQGFDPNVMGTIATGSSIRF